ncbi:MAG: cation:proton antiporter [Candidatus Omnitrophica bacterium]|nr:cation:proton antiporter [Candidatus Omnitrophota bacterium]
MQPILIVGIIVITGFLFGELAERIRLPKITGYILAGILLNPDVVKFMPSDVIKHTALVTNISLSFITFSVGGTLLYSRIKKLGKSILYITLFEAESAFICVIVGLLIVMPFFMHATNSAWATTFIPISILLAALASPTDPSATLAITHEYKAKGSVSSTIMAAAAFDDVLGIINYSLAVVIANTLIMHKAFNVENSLLEPLRIIAGALLLGSAFGVIFNKVSSLLSKKSDGVLIVLVLGFLTLCFGTASLVQVDQLLSTMVMGIVVVNFNLHRDKVFAILERYTEELIFVLFFTISGMQLDFGVLAKSFILVLFFVLFRTIGKVLGTRVGAWLSNAPPKVKKYAAGGLIPQGGIVIGLALMMKQDPAFSAISDIIISVTIGSTVVHELIGPIIAKTVLKKAGEIPE